MIATRRFAILVAIAVAAAVPFASLPTLNALSPAIAGDALVTRIVRVSDGDTVHAMIDGRAVRVRLASIDAPESGQAFGDRSRRALADMVVDRDVELQQVGTDAYKRPLVVLVVDGVSINAELVRLGWAWVFRRFSNDAALIALENTARKSRWGLWVDPDPVAPWEFRRLARSR